MYPLDFSVAAGAQRAQFLSWEFPTDTQIQKPFLTHHRKPAVLGFWSPLGLPNSKTVHAGPRRQRTNPTDTLNMGLYINILICARM